MKKLAYIPIVIALLMGSISTMGQSKPTDPMSKGSAAISFDFGPGVPYYYGNGFGPAMVFKFDYSLFEVGPGTISFGGLMGFSYFWDSYYYATNDYNYSTTNLGLAFRAAYHYGFDVEGLDCYGGFGIGPRFTFYNDDYNYNNRDDFSAGALPCFFLGTSYYFNDVVGINGEVGYGFTYAQLGMTFKIK
jgi:hypothetical protein